MIGLTSRCLDRSVCALRDPEKRIYGDCMTQYINGIVPGAPVIVHLNNPREKLWGVVLQIDSTGVYIRGVDLNTFGEWLPMISRGEPNIGFTTLFLPMWRIDKVLLDESIDDLRSLADQFKERVGVSVGQFLQYSKSDS